MKDKKGTALTEKSIREGFRLLGLEEKEREAYADAKTYAVQLAARQRMDALTQHKANEILKRTDHA